jgi:hypothetical protein
MQTHLVKADDDDYEEYRKRMMLAYRFRPNPMVSGSRRWRVASVLCAVTSARLPCGSAEQSAPILLLALDGACNAFVCSDLRRIHAMWRRLGQQLSRQV